MSRGKIREGNDLIMILSYDAILTERGLLGNLWTVTVRVKRMSQRPSDSKRTLRDGDAWDVGEYEYDIKIHTMKDRHHDEP
jgi:hypothetical protein